METSANPTPDQSLPPPDLEFHPAAALFPLMDVDGAEFGELVDDIREHGLVQPIVRFEGKILDGRNRYRAYQHAGDEPSYVEWHGESPTAYVISLNLHRRHLTDGQRAAIAVEAMERFEEEAREAQKRAGTVRTSQALDEAGGDRAAAVDLIVDAVESAAVNGATVAIYARKLAMRRGFREDLNDYCRTHGGRLTVAVVNATIPASKSVHRRQHGQGEAAAPPVRRHVVRRDPRQDRRAGGPAEPPLQQRDRCRPVLGAGGRLPGSQDTAGGVEAARRERAGVAGRDASHPIGRARKEDQMTTQFYALMEQHPEIDVALVEGGPFDRSPSGEFTWAVLGAAATHLRKETGVKIRASKRYAASQGQMVGQVPAGYCWQGEGRDRGLVIDKDLAPIVRRVFEEYATGRFSARDIARRLNAEGVMLPSFKGGWRMDTVSQMLGNPAYAGYTYLSRKRREGELIRGQWPAIVELDTWQAVQLLIQRRRLIHGGRKIEAETRAYAFRGLLRCARCGLRMHAHHLHGRNYFDCRGSDSPNPCRGMLREDRLFPWAEALFQSIDAYRPADLAEAVDERLQQPIPHASPAALAQIDATLARLGKRFEWGHVDEATYLAEHARLTQQREELERGANRPVPTSLPLGSRMEGWRTGDPRIRRRLLAAFFDEIDVLDGEVVSIVPRAEYAAEVVALLENVAAVTRS